MTGKNRSKPLSEQNLYVIYEHQYKNGIIQYKNERIAILKRQVGAQVQFIIAYDDLTKEGYELKAIDEGRSVDTGIGTTGGAMSYYYFQKLNPQG